MKERLWKEGRMGGKGQKKKGIKEDGEGRERKRLRNLGHCGLFMHRFWHPGTDSSSVENKKTRGVG